MTLMRWQPMNEMVDLSELFNRSFQRNGNGQLEPLRLALDVFETEENLILRAAIPGATKEDIKVEFEDQYLTVTAQVNRPELPENAKSILQESTFGSVTRTLKIARRLDVENSKGTFVDGVLEVREFGSRGVECGEVARVLGLGLLLDGELVVQIELGGMHQLGGLLGLPRQIVQLCQRVIGGIRADLSGQRGASHGHADDRTDEGSPKTIDGPVRAVEPQDLCVLQLP